MVKYVFTVQAVVIIGSVVFKIPHIHVIRYGIRVQYCLKTKRYLYNGFRCVTPASICLYGAVAVVQPFRGKVYAAMWANGIAELGYPLQPSFGKCIDT